MMDPFHQPLLPLPIPAVTGPAREDQNSPRAPTHQVLDHRGVQASGARHRKDRGSIEPVQATHAAGATFSRHEHDVGVGAGSREE